MVAIYILLRHHLAEIARFPKGLVIRTGTGGPKTLKNILLELKKYLFTGYVIVTLTRRGRTSWGYIVVRRGFPILSVHFTGKEQKIGRPALSKVWKDSHNDGARIEVHARVEIDEIIRRYSDKAIIDRQHARPSKTEDEERLLQQFETEIVKVEEPSKEPVEPAPELAEPVMPEDQAETETTEPEPDTDLEGTSEPEVAATSEQEQEVSQVGSTPAPEEVAPKEQEKPGEEIPEPEEPESGTEVEEKPEPPEEVALPSITGVAVEALTEDEKMEGTLAIWKGKGYNVETLEKAMKKDKASAMKAFSKFEEDLKKMEVLKTILVSMSTKGYEEKVENLKAKLTNPDYLLAVEAEIQLLRENIDRKERLEKTKVQPKKKYEVPPTSLDEESNLILKYSFDNFVVGQSNRFPWGAALSVAKTVTTEESSTLYNPLFVWSGPGLGKTHLLNAIGNYIKKRRPDARILYTTAERFMSELLEAIDNIEINEFRMRYRNLDTLLIDDVQFLAGNERAQEELFHTFNDLYNAKKQIALACDRAPREIPSIEDRLVSRFESGLVVDIRVPDPDTRLGILIKRSEENKLKVEKDVLELIANIVTDNIRELEGTLNKVVAYSALMHKELTIGLAEEVLKDMIRDDIKISPRRVSKTLTPGRNYIVEEAKPHRCFEISMKAVSEGYQPLLITRLNPKRIRHKYGLESGKILWLRDKDSETEETVAPVLENILGIIEDFLKERKVIVLIDGAEYLITMNGFDAVIRFLRNIFDEVSETESTFLLSVSPKTLKEWEIKTLEKEMEILEIGAQD
jgi:chromosomal replication initiator protein DnaA